MRTWIRDKAHLQGVMLVNVVPSAHESIAKNPVIGIGVTFEAEPTLASIFSVCDVYDVVFGEDFHPVAAD